MNALPSLLLCWFSFEYKSNHTEGMFEMTHDMSSNKSRIFTRRSNPSSNVSISFLTLVGLFAMATTTKTITTIHCYGYTMVPQLLPLPLRNWNNHRRDSMRSIVVVKGAEEDGGITATALPTNTIITLDGQEIRQEITAMNNIIFVRVKDALSTTTGGIVLPDQSKQRPTEGTVVACGPGKIHPHTGNRIKNPISVGMNVV